MRGGGVERVRSRYGYGPLPTYGLLKGGRVSDEVEDLRGKGWHDAPAPETIYEHFS